MVVSHEDRRGQDAHKGEYDELHQAAVNGFPGH
jgi:hypothetical protein